jgi:hypothetical protein
MQGGDHTAGKATLFLVRMEEPFEVAGFRIEPVQAVLRTNPKNIICAFSQGCDRIITDCIVDSRTGLVRCKPVALWFKPVQPTCPCADPDASMAILQDGSDIIAGEALLLERLVNIMGKCIGGPIHKIESVLGADPELAIPIQVEHINVIMADARRPEIVVHVALEYLSMGVVTVQAPLSRGDPNVPVWILDDGGNPAVTQAGGIIRVRFEGLEGVAIVAI